MTVKKVRVIKEAGDMLSPADRRELLALALMARELSVCQQIPDDLRSGLAAQADTWDNLRRQ